MIDERFAAEKFSTLGIDTPAAKELAEELADEVNVELHETLAAEVKRIVERLNAMGHGLKIEEFNPGSISFRDDFESDTGYHCRLRLAVDTVVSSGYAHLANPQEE